MNVFSRRCAAIGFLPAAIVLSASFVTSSAFAGDEIGVCVKASEQAQSLRQEGKYRLAREQLIVCSREVCPGIVRKDCAQWLGEVEGSIPTIVVSAKDASGDLAAVRVTVDGALLTERLDGKPLLMDPGEHNFVFEKDGAPPKNERVVVRAGEKNRLLQVTFDSAQPNAGAVVAAAEGPSPQPTSHPIPRAAIGLGVAGVVAFGVGLGLGISGKSNVSNLRDTCGQTMTCNPSDITKDKTQLAIGDILMAAGIVSVGVGAVLLLTSHPADSSAPPPAAAKLVPTFDVKRVPGGGIAVLGGSF